MMTVLGRFAGMFEVSRFWKPRNLHCRISSRSIPSQSVRACKDTLLYDGTDTCATASSRGPSPSANTPRPLHRTDRPRVRSPIFHSAARLTPLSTGSSRYAPHNGHSKGHMFAQHWDNSLSRLWCLRSSRPSSIA